MADRVADASASPQSQDTTTEPKESRRWLRICVGIGISFMSAHVGRRRLVADGSRHGEEKSGWAATELHGDGADAFGQYVPDLLAESSELDRTTSQEQFVSDEGLVLAVLSGLHHLGSHAKDWAVTAGERLDSGNSCPERRLHDRDWTGAASHGGPRACGRESTGASSLCSSPCEPTTGQVSTSLPLGRPEGHFSKPRHRRFELHPAIGLLRVGRRGVQPRG